MSFLAQVWVLEENLYDPKKDDEQKFTCTTGLITVQVM